MKELHVKSRALTSPLLIYQQPTSVPLKDSVPFVKKKNKQEDELQSEYNKSGSCSEPNKHPDEKNVHKNIKSLIHVSADTQQLLPLLPPLSPDNTGEFMRHSNSVFESASKVCYSQLCSGCQRP
jgi:hypothetical protein